MKVELENDIFKKVVRISDEELVQLWETYRNNKSDRAIRDKLIVQYIYLARYVIGRIKINLPQAFSYDDILSYGIEGLIEAIEKYAPARGAKFETYALMRIRGAIIDKIRESDWLPRSMRRKIKEIQTTFKELKIELDRNPTLSEVADRLGMEKYKIEEILSAEAGVDSLYDKKTVGEETIDVIDTLIDFKHESPEEMAERNDVKKELEMALRKLPERERVILICYYHNNMTLKEIGDIIDVSESRACQLHAQAIIKLRNVLSETKLDRLLKPIIAGDAK